MSKVGPGPQYGGYSAYPYPPPGVQPPPPAYQPPPPPGYAPPGAQSSSTTVVVNQPMGGFGPQPGQLCRYREVPCLIVCQYCNATVTTTTCYSVGTITWVVAGVILFLGFWLGCCLIPFCIDACKDVIHSCPNCHQNVGRYNRM